MFTFIERRFGKESMKDYVLISEQERILFVFDFDFAKNIKVLWTEHRKHAVQFQRDQAEDYLKEIKKDCINIKPVIVEDE
jgi:hypothetical protein